MATLRLVVSLGLCVLASPSAFAQQETLTIGVNNFIGCQSSDMLKKIIEYDSSGDKEAARKLLTSTFDSGECIRFLIGDTVYVTDYSVWSKMVRLCLKGKVTEYWTTCDFSKNKKTK